MNTVAQEVESFRTIILCTRYNKRGKNAEDLIKCILCSLGGDRHRRRRKEEEGRGSPPAASAAHAAAASKFDLEATAFPPLPAGAVLKTISVETETAPQSHWGENRFVILPPAALAWFTFSSFSSKSK